MLTQSIFFCVTANEFIFAQNKYASLRFVYDGTNFNKYGFLAILRCSYIGSFVCLFGYIHLFAVLFSSSK